MVLRPRIINLGVSELPLSNITPPAILESLSRILVLTCWFSNFSLLKLKEPVALSLGIFWYPVEMFTASISFTL